MTCLALATALMLSSSTILSMPAPATPTVDRRHTHVIAGTEIFGDTDPRVWRSVLDILPVRPRRIVLLDAGTLSAEARQKVRGYEAFVVAGNPTVFVLRQAMTLRQAETGDAFDRAVLASVIHHELSHVRGLDERGAIQAEQDLWRRLIAARLVDFALGSTYLRRLEDERQKPRTDGVGAINAWSGPTLPAHGSSRRRLPGKRSMPSPTPLSRRSARTRASPPSSNGPI